MKLLLVDIGATHFRIGVGNEKTMRHILTIDTPNDWRLGVQQIIVQAKQHAVSAVIVGLPGTLDEEQKTLLRAPYLTSWVHAPIAKELHAALHIPIVLENDALLNAMGEAVYGAGKKDQIVGFLTISSGVNGARIIAGQPDPGAFPFELGLLPVHGVTIESLISGRGLHRVHHVEPEELSESAWRAVERSLSIAVTELLLIWRPDIFVLAGPMIREKKIQSKRVLELVTQRWQHPADVPPIVPATLDDVSGLWGALALAHLHSEAIFGRVEQRPS